MTESKKYKGSFYEKKAREFLKLNGYTVLRNNFFSRWGEIDIIAKDGIFFAFIEVKARKKDSQIRGLESVDVKKRERIRKTALLYVSGRKDNFYRFDVLEIIHGESWRQYNLIKNAFDMNE